ncbi:MAG: hypothetical protein WD895_09190 [Acidimicrobiia bacterium]
MSREDALAADLGYSYEVRKSGEIVISRHGVEVTILRGDAVKKKFIIRVTTLDPQQVMARFTGDYKRGNERG